LGRACSHFLGISHPFEVVLCGSCIRPELKPYASSSGIPLQGWRKGVYGGFAPCMVNTVTTVGLGFFGYDFGVEYYKRYIMDKPRNPTPGVLRCAMPLFMQQGCMINGSQLAGVMCVALDTFFFVTSRCGPQHCVSSPYEQGSAASLRALQPSGS
jgi:hypothetical protein